MMRSRKTVMNKVGKYEIKRTIGESTFMKVKFAQNTETRESVAMKVLDKGAIVKHKMVDQDTYAGEKEGFVETNQLGQVKIASKEKTRKWIWVNAKRYRGILRCRLARLKWEQRRKPFQRKKIRRINHLQSHIYTFYLVIGSLCPRIDEGQGKAGDFGSQRTGKGPQNFKDHS